MVLDNKIFMTAAAPTWVPGLHRLSQIFRPSCHRHLYKLARGSNNDGTAERLVNPATALDVFGGAAVVPLVDFESLNTALKSSSPSEAYASQEMIELVLAQLQREPLQPVDATKREKRVLTTVLKVDDAAHKAKLVQERALARMFGAVAAGSGDDVIRGNVEKYLRRDMKQDLPNLWWAQADCLPHTYCGFIWGLIKAKCVDRAIALAADTAAPAVDTRTMRAIIQAVVVPLTDEAKAESLLAAMHAKDQLVMASNSCVTILGDLAAKSGASTMVQFVTKRKESPYDPAIVYRTSVSDIQKWGQEHTTKCLSPITQHAAIIKKMSELPMVPRHTALSALSFLTMSDVARPWLIAALQDKTNRAAVQDASSAPPVKAEFAAELKAMSESTILEDPIRYLVHSRLLDTYTDLLSRDLIDVHDRSFPLFLEECGECYLGERPKELLFVMKMKREAVDLGFEAVRQILSDLAPTCSFWTTLLHLQSAVTFERSGSSNVYRFTVALPSKHDCLRNVASQQCVDLPKIEVLYEDSDIVAFEKPAGLPTTRHALCQTQQTLQRAANGAADGETSPLMNDVVSTLLQDPARSDYMQRVMRCGMLHRLDRDTSGVLVFAKNEETFCSLRHQIGSSAEFGHFPKIYLALCVVLEPNLAHTKVSGTIQDMLDPRLVTRYSISKFFSHARIALVECRIQQGKKHQIRRHLASIGMPILQDQDHGGSATCSPLIRRGALHASAITFVHPRTTRVMSIASPLPEDFVSALRLLAEDEKHLVK